MMKSRYLINYFVTGYGRHGKDEAAVYINNLTGLSYKGSSLAAAEIFIFDALKDKYGYASYEECFQDRHNHRAEWYNLIAAYNNPDLTKLAQGIFKSNRIYVGIRNRQELDACRKSMDVTVIWIDASERLPPESDKSCTVGIDQADIIIPNNGSVAQFHKRLHKLSAMIAPPRVLTNGREILE